MRLDLQAECAAALQTRGNKPKRRGDKFEFRCHRHDDKNASAFLGNKRWGCLACGIEEPIELLCADLGIEVPKSGMSFTLEDYAELKGFSVATLQKWGLKSVSGAYGDVVAIP